MTPTGWFLLGGVAVIAAVWVWCVREKPEKRSNVVPLRPPSNVQVRWTDKGGAA